MSDSLGKRELDLIRLYANCELGLSPQKFYLKWSVSYEQIAQICSRSYSTVQRWFKRNHHYRRPQPHDLKNLAFMDFLLEHFEEIPDELLEILCQEKQRAGK
ncbi:MAG: helix-turn-helix domain-containing protein [Spirulinaceae cyanobacterium]